MFLAPTRRRRAPPGIGYIAYDEATGGFSWVNDSSTPAWMLPPGTDPASLPPPPAEVGLPNGNSYMPIVNVQDDNPYTPPLQATPVQVDGGYTVTPVIVQQPTQAPAPAPGAPAGGAMPPPRNTDEANMQAYMTAHASEPWAVLEVAKRDGWSLATLARISGQTVAAVAAWLKAPLPPQHNADERNMWAFIDANISQPWVIAEVAKRDGWSLATLARVMGMTVDDMRALLSIKAPPKPFTPIPGQTFENATGDFYFEGRPVRYDDFQKVRAQLVAEKNAYNINYQGTMGPEWHLSDLAARIASVGLDDIRRIGFTLREMRGGPTGEGESAGYDPDKLTAWWREYFDKKTGEPIDGIGNKGGDSFASTAAGEHSNVNYLARFTAAGTPVFALQVNKTGLMVELAPWIEGFGFLMSVVPGLGLMVGSAVVGAVAGEAFVLANPALSNIIGKTVVNTVLSGGDVAKAVTSAVRGAAQGAITGGAATLVGDLAKTAALAAGEAALVGDDVQVAIDAAIDKGADMRLAEFDDWGETIDYGAGGDAYWPDEGGDWGEVIDYGDATGGDWWADTGAGDYGETIDYGAGDDAWWPDEGGDYGTPIDYGADAGGDWWGVDAGAGDGGGGDYSDDVGDTGNYGDDGTDMDPGNDGGGDDAGYYDPYYEGDGTGWQSGTDYNTGDGGGGASGHDGSGGGGSVNTSTAGPGGWGDFAALAKTLITAGASLAQIVATFKSGGAPNPLTKGAIQTLADGSKVVNNGNGTTTITGPDGKVRTVATAKGVATTMLDGSISIANGNGTATVVKANGTTTTVKGTLTTTTPAAPKPVPTTIGQTVTWPDGTMLHKNQDGSISVKKPDGTITKQTVAAVTAAAGGKAPIDTKQLLLWGAGGLAVLMLVSGGGSGGGRR